MTRAEIEFSEFARAKHFRTSHIFFFFLVLGNTSKNIKIKIMYWNVNDLSLSMDHNIDGLCDCANRRMESSEM